MDGDGESPRGEDRADAESDCTAVSVADEQKSWNGGWEPTRGRWSVVGTSSGTPLLADATSVGPAGPDGVGDAMNRESDSCAVSELGLSTLDSVEAIGPCVKWWVRAFAPRWWPLPPPLGALCLLCRCRRGACGCYCPRSKPRGRSVAEKGQHGRRIVPADRVSCSSFLGLLWLVVVLGTAVAATVLAYDLDSASGASEVADHGSFPGSGSSSGGMHFENSSIPVKLWEEPLLRRLRTMADGTSHAGMLVIVGVAAFARRFADYSKRSWGVLPGTATARNAHVLIFVVSLLQLGQVAFLAIRFCETASMPDSEAHVRTQDRIHIALALLSGVWSIGCLGVAFLYVYVEAYLRWRQCQQLADALLPKHLQSGRKWTPMSAARGDTERPVRRSVSRSRLDSAKSRASTGDSLLYDAATRHSRPQSREGGRAFTDLRITNFDDALLEHRRLRDMVRESGNFWGWPLAMLLTSTLLTAIAAFAWAALWHPSTAAPNEPSPAWFLVLGIVLSAYGWLYLWVLSWTNGSHKRLIKRVAEETWLPSADQARFLQYLEHNAAFWRVLGVAVTPDRVTKVGVSIFTSSLIVVIKFNFFAFESNAGASPVVV